MLPRNIESSLLESLAHFPVTLLVGARQVGKSTLVQKVCADSWVARYLSLDDRVVLDSALDNPDGLLRDLTGNVALDEVQRAPDLLRAVKLVVDKDRRPGRFLLTGSANVATLSAVSETLAGRAAVLTLHPFSIQESRGLGGAGALIDELFSLEDATAVVDAIPATKKSSRPSRS